MQRHDVALTLSRRCINVMCLLGECPSQIWLKIYIYLQQAGASLQSCLFTSKIGVALITHITHVRNMRKKNISQQAHNIKMTSYQRRATLIRRHFNVVCLLGIYNKVSLHKILCFFTIGAALKGKNLLPLGANSFL